MKVENIFTELVRVVIVNLGKISLIVFWGFNLLSATIMSNQKWRLSERHILNTKLCARVNQRHLGGSFRNWWFVWCHFCFQFVLMRTLRNKKGTNNPPLPPPPRPPKKYRPWASQATYISAGKRAITVGG